MNRTIRINLWTSLTLVLLVSLVLPWTAFAAVWTDKLDYSPGETVTIRGDNSDGAGYIAGETVHVDVVGPNDYTAMCDGVAADTDNADWSCQVILWDSDLAYGTYYYTATGLTSGVVEQGTFTDAAQIRSLEGTSCSGSEIHTFVLGAPVCAQVSGLSQNPKRPSSGTVKWWAPGLDPDAHPATRTSIFENVSSGIFEDYPYTPFAFGTWTIRVDTADRSDEGHFEVIPEVTIESPADWEVIAITSGVEVKYSWLDTGTGEDTFKCIVDWDDGTDLETLEGCTTPQTIAHDYTSVGAGLYEITITVVENVHQAAGTASITVVVYDPDAGFVTGGGWFDSPAGSYRMEGQVEDQGGPATFGFVSKYQRGATVPEGETEFQFHRADFGFHSDTYDWLVVNKDGTNAQYKGLGVCTVQGVDRACSFMLWGTDGETGGEADTFRITIWDDAEAPLYDNGTYTPINEGNIIVHTSGK